MKGRVQGAGDRTVLIQTGEVGGAGSEASQGEKAGRSVSQGKVCRGTKMHSDHGWGGPVPGEVRGPGEIDSSIFFYLAPDLGNN